MRACRTSGWNVDDHARAPARRALDADRAVEDPSPAAGRWRAPDRCRSPSSYRSRRRSALPRRRTFRGRCRRPSSGRPAARLRDSITCVETVMRPGFDCRLSTALAIRFSRIRRKRDRIADHPRKIRQVGRELDLIVSLRGANDVGDERVQIALAPVQRRRQPLIAGGQRLEIRDAGIDGLPALGEHDRKGARARRVRPAPDGASRFEAGSGRS